jgi:ankyrin repeat protein
MEVIETLLDAGADPTYSTRHGESVLMVLARRAEPHALRIFLERTGVDVNESDSEGDTALMEAAVVGAGDNVMVLLDAGAHAAACTVNGGTAAAGAAAAGHTEIADAINSAMKEQAQ